MHGSPGLLANVYRNERPPLTASVCAPRFCNFVQLVVRYKKIHIYSRRVIRIDRIFLSTRLMLLFGIGEICSSRCVQGKKVFILAKHLRGG